MVKRGELWWADLGTPRGSEPGFLRPTVIISADHVNASRLSTVIVAVVTSTTRLATMPGNVLLPTDLSGLDRESVVNVTQLVTVDRLALIERVGSLPGWVLGEIDAGLARVLGLTHRPHP